MNTSDYVIFATFLTLTIKVIFDYIQWHRELRDIRLNVHEIKHLQEELTQKVADLRRRILRIQKNLAQEVKDRKKETSS